MEFQESPHSIDAEEGVIACCLLEEDGHHVDTCSALGMTAEDFHVTQNKLIYEHIVALKESGKSIHPISLLDSMKGDMTPQEVMRIQDRVEVCNERHVKEFAGIVLEKSKLRKLIRMSRLGIESAFNGSSEAGDICAQYDKSMQEMAESDFVEFNMEDMISKAAHDLTTINSEMVIPFGIQSYDNSITDGGLKAGQVAIIAARPGRGKTTLALNIAGRTLNNQHGVGIFSLEMSSIELVKKMVCMKSGVDFARFKDGLQTPDDEQRFHDAKQKMAKWNLVIDDSTFMSPAKIKSVARAWKRTHDIKLLVIDYLQLISGTNSKAGREEQIADISRNIKCLAKELKIPIILLAQLNRECEKENRAPKLTDLRESGSIEQDADIVTFLFVKQSDMDMNGHTSILRWNRPKQRNGPSDRFGEFRFNGQLGRISD